MLANWRQPSTPHSLPKPLRPTPPEGKVGSDLGMSLTKPRPQRMRSITSSPLEALKTDPPSPQVPLLATLMACSSLSMRKSWKTGPNSSSSHGSSEPSMTVMGKKGFSISLRCQVILQDFGRFLSWLVRLSWRSSRASGPMRVSLFMGSPNLILERPSMSLVRKASQWFLWMMKRLGEKQTWPAFAHLPASADTTAWFTSPSSSTMNGSFPPSSITDLFRYLPAFSAMSAPPREEPVKLTPQTESRVKIRSICSWLVKTFWYSPLLKPALTMQSSMMRPMEGQESALRVRRTLPRRRLGSPPLKLRQKGQLKGTRQQMVPSGRYLTMACFLASPWTRCGRIGAQFSLQYLQNRIALLTSPSASTIGLPISAVMASVASLNLSCTQSPRRLMSAARSWMLRFFWISKACSARFSLRSSSSLEMKLMVSLSLPVKGFLETMARIS